jgi:hypothetical protein
MNNQITTDIVYVLRNKMTGKFTHQTDEEEDGPDTNGMKYTPFYSTVGPARSVLTKMKKDLEHHKMMALRHPATSWNDQASIKTKEVEIQETEIVKVERIWNVIEVMHSK